MDIVAIRVALIDDHELFRTALGRTLRDHGFEVVAEGGDARHTFRDSTSNRPRTGVCSICGCRPWEGFPRCASCAPAIQALKWSC